MSSSSGTATVERSAGGSRAARHPRDLLELLLDPGSLELLRTNVRSRRLGDRARAGDGVVGGAGEIDGRPVACFAQDPAFLGGSLGEEHADTILRVLRLAEAGGIPVIACVASAGARLQEGAAALEGYGAVFREQVALSGRVPQITYVSAVAAGGGAYSPALTDFVVMRRDASMFLTGPDVIREVMREDVDRLRLGGTSVHSRNGVCHLEADDDEHAACLIRELLSHLPQESAQLPPSAEPREPPPADFERVVPTDPRRVYDVRRVLRGLVDGGDLLEIAPCWAPNMVCAFARLDGVSVSVVANQPKRIGGAIDVAASEKAAYFVSRCDAFRLPLLVFVDTPGFLPGCGQEAQGVIRHGAGLVRAFAGASVVRLTVVLRKAYGGAYISMNSKALGAQLVFAWPTAEVGVMGAQPAARIVHRAEFSAAANQHAELERLSSVYADRHLRAAVAAEEGYVDEVIAPAETRSRLAWALRKLARPRRRAQDRRAPSAAGC
jgi:acetyl-CoA carboxylase carboxyltransferase component